MSAKAIDVHNLSFQYQDQADLSRVSFGLNTGQMMGIIGPNGAGKSTLLDCMLGLLPTYQGEVRFFGKPFQSVRKSIAYVPQRDQIDLNFPATVFDFVLTGRYPHLPFYRAYGKKDKQLARQALEDVDMEKLAKRHISALSGGQFKRMLIARAFTQQAQLLLLDEPFAGVDAQSEERIIQLLRDYVAEGHTVVAVHHDLSTLERYFDWVLLLNVEVKAQGFPKDVLQDTQTKSIYGLDTLS